MGTVTEPHSQDGSSSQGVSVTDGVLFSVVVEAGRP